MHISGYATGTTVEGERSTSLFSLISVYFVLLYTRLYSVLACVLYPAVVAGDGPP